MNKVLSIYDAKTNLSKLVKRAEKGETIQIGAYGKPQVELTAIKKKTGVNWGAIPGLLDDFDFDEFQALDDEMNWEVK